MIWNGLPEFIRNAESQNLFKFRLKTYLFESYVPPTIPAEELLYVGKLSLCYMKLTIRK